MDYQKATKNIRKCLAGYIKKHNLKSLVLGVSGGIDSALCAALAKPVCDELNIELIGRSLPIETNKSDEIFRAYFIGKHFCSDFKNIDLTNTSKPFINSIFIDNDIDNKNDVRQGNIKARIRMIYLYDLAQATNGLVLSTDNYTEYLLGFWTIHGDVGDWGALQNLWKTEVYEMSTWIIENEDLTAGQQYALSRCIQAVPTDGLGITNSDMDQIGCKDYYEVDSLIQEYKAEKHPVIQRHISTHFKRNNPFNLTRDEIIG